MPPASLMATGKHANILESTYCEYVLSSGMGSFALRHFALVRRFFALLSADGISLQDKVLWERWNPCCAVSGIAISSTVISGCFQYGIYYVIKCSFLQMFQLE
jgi:hypothetical protein